MSLLEHEQASNDAELISRVRAGDLEAYGELFARHREAANRLARSLVSGSEADDLVAEAFNKVLSVLTKGGGPDIAFRAYLLTSVRRLHIDHLRSQQRSTPTDDLSALESETPTIDPVIDEFEGGAATKAFSSLPERWQLVLWHLEVENQKPAQIAPLLGMSANSVSALAYRAREGLRQAFLNEHAQVATDSACREINPHLGAYVRGALSKRDTARVESHLDGCRKCTAAYLELSDVNKSIGAVIAPVVLGSAAAGYLATSTGHAVLGAGIAALFGRVRDVIAGNAAATTAAAAATVVVAGAAVTGTIAALDKPDQKPTPNAAKPPSKVVEQSPPKVLVPPTTPKSNQNVSPPESTLPPAVSEVPVVPEEPEAPQTPNRPQRPHKTPPAVDSNSPSAEPTVGPAQPSPSEPSTPAKPAADARVEIDAIQAILAGGYRVVVSNVPANAEAQVDVVVTGASFSYVNVIPFLSGPCTGPDTHFVCTAGPGTTVFHFTRLGFAGVNPSVSVTLTPLGFADGDSANDTISLPLY
ncbi:MAG TPA: sigma-70 family RNA polymerase sigma factor [Marmoricola sp.]|nr:sigma-70 family RNA polymerase sigma factor [Marmoricola sp.]HNJ77770.1 sigma-70 family RNA polymerase sigma factor [Marmoricola sp.]HNO39340.1 sigma-70 family RNA polymerase sigma factor [Marmoricola sp.]